MYGSSVNGLALKGDSDLDLAIILPDDMTIDPRKILDPIKK
jgi:hypothetical protein